MFGSIKMWGLFIALAGVVATGYMAVSRYNSALSENVQLKQDVAVKSAENKLLVERQTAINEAVTSNDTETRQITERTNTIQEKIREVPIKTECVTSPAIAVVLAGLRSSSIDSTNPNPVP